VISYETQRLVLREWHDDDFDKFYALNQDSDVMHYFPELYGYGKTVQLIEVIKSKFIKYGFGFYTCELKATKEFVGSIGINVPDVKMHFTPCVEIGWRVAKQYWQQGFAYEAAQKCLEIGFTEFNLDEIVAFTAKCNRPSERLMQKLGMQHNVNDDFCHPKLDYNHPLNLHVLYRLSKHNWLDSRLVIQR
jgi:RimJ/RimL family protein N-acetyltransferase